MVLFRSCYTGFRCIRGGGKSYSVNCPLCHGLDLSASNLVVPEAGSLTASLRMNQLMMGGGYL